MRKLCDGSSPNFRLDVAKSASLFDAIFVIFDGNIFRRVYHSYDGITKSLGQADPCTGLSLNGLP